jgi:predicted aspartyl protease
MARTLRRRRGREKHDEDGLVGPAGGWHKDHMGLLSVEVVVRGRGGRVRSVEMLVDSGAAWSCLPERVWKAIGLRATRTCQFSLADTSQISRKVSGCWFSYQGIEAPSPVILGEGDDVALLGVVTLESLGLVLNPLRRTLQPMKLLLMAARKAKDIPPDLFAEH